MDHMNFTNTTNTWNIINLHNIPTIHHQHHHHHQHYQDQDHHPPSNCTPVAAWPLSWINQHQEPIIKNKDQDQDPITKNNDIDGDDDDDDDEEELGEVKEAMYGLAAMRAVEMDEPASTVRRPGRRNVRISDDPQSAAARRRRERISERMRVLKRLVPGGAKMDTAAMLDEAARYVKFLKRQIRRLQSPDDHPPRRP